MSDTTPAGWLPDPTGRHDHRYWDGSRWTEHVADAGVAATDPQGAPDLPPPGAAAPGPSAAQPATTDPSPTSEQPATTDPAPTVEQPAASDPAPTAETPAAPGPAPTAVGPVPTQDPTAVWPAPDALTPPAAAHGGPPPPAAPATPVAAEGAGGGGRKGFFIGLGVLLVVLLGVGAFLLLGDDDDDADDGDERERIRTEMAAAIADDDIPRSVTECMTDRIVDELGVDRLRDVDFSADGPPADLEDDFNDAARAAYLACSPEDDLGLGDDPGRDDDLDLDDLDLDLDDDLGLGDDLDLDDVELGEGFVEMLAGMYADMFDLSPQKAECLAEKIADSIDSAGAIDEGAMMTEIFDHFADCDISLSELGTP